LPKISHRILLSHKNVLKKKAPRPRNSSQGCIGERGFDVGKSGVDMGAIRIHGGRFLAGVCGPLSRAPIECYTPNCSSQASCDYSCLRRGWVRPSVPATSVVSSEGMDTAVLTKLPRCFGCSSKQPIKATSHRHLHIDEAGFGSVSHQSVVKYTISNNYIYVKHNLYKIKSPPRSPQAPLLAPMVKRRGLTGEWAHPRR